MIVSGGEYVEYQSFRAYFELEPGSGYAFECDENGVIDVDTLSEVALVNLRKCQASGISPSIEDYSGAYRTARCGVCVCGAEVSLDSFTNVCEGCDRLYNSAGQELVDPSLWGEETGECAADLIGL